ncbi:hypothetical protein Efla_004614 [Eimeria flavescens]
MERWQQQSQQQQQEERRQQQLRQEQQPVAAAAAAGEAQRSTEELLLRERRRQQQALLTPLSGDPKCPLVRDSQQQEIVRQHTFDDTVRSEGGGGSSFSLFSRSSSEFRCLLGPVGHLIPSVCLRLSVFNSPSCLRRCLSAAYMPPLGSFSKAEEEALAADLAAMRDLSPEDAASIAAEIRARTFSHQQQQQQRQEQQQQQQQLQISGAVRAAESAPLHPLHADARHAAAANPAGAAAAGRSGVLFREVKSGQLHADTSDEEEQQHARAAAAAAAPEPRQQQQQQQQQHEEEGEEQQDESPEEKCERIEATIRSKAEADLTRRRAEMALLRADAERQLLSLQLLPPQTERLSALPTAFRESLFGVFVCLCLRHIEECDEDFRAEVTEWALAFLDTIASPNLLHLSAHVANCLRKPIAWREQLQKDGVRASDIVTLDPLLDKLGAYFSEKQPQTDALFFSVQSRLRANRSSRSPSQEPPAHRESSSSSSGSNSSSSGGSAVPAARRMPSAPPTTPATAAPQQQQLQRQQLQRQQEEREEAQREQESLLQHQQQQREAGAHHQQQQQQQQQHLAGDRRSAAHPDTWQQHKREQQQTVAAAAAAVESTRGSSSSSSSSELTETAYRLAREAEAEDDVPAGLALEGLARVARRQLHQQQQQQQHEQQREQHQQDGEVDGLSLEAEEDERQQQQEEDSYSGMQDSLTDEEEEEEDRLSGMGGVTFSMLGSDPPPYSVVFLRDLTTALVTNGTFDARVQMLLDRLAFELRINPLLLSRIEENLAADLLSILQANTKEGSKQRTWRRLKIAGAAVGGGVLLAITAGLAAPGIAAAVASLGSLPLSAFLASAGGMAALVSIFGAGGAALIAATLRDCCC